VRAHGHLGDHQLLGNLTIALALRHKPQDIQLALGQRISCRRGFRRMRIPVVFQAIEVQ
jgi:hypothetical protein